jgi:hypothetical protein
MSDNDIWFVKTYSLGQLSTSLHEINNTGGGFSLYPNPATSTCTFDFEKEISQILIHNIDGKMISKFNPGKKQGTFNVDQLPNGVYNVSAEFSDGRKVFKKLLILHP